MFNRSIITKTHQWWKYLLGTAALFVGVGTTMAALYYGSELHYTVAVPLHLSGLGVAIFGFAFSAITIKCPGCGLRWLWYAYSRKPINDWFFWLVATEQCPECGYPQSPESTSEHPPAAQIPHSDIS